MNKFTIKNIESCNEREVMSRWSQRAMMMIAATLFAMAPTQANAQGKSAKAAPGQQWTFDLQTQGGRAHGRVYFKKAGGACYQAGTDGYLDDTASDNTSLEVILVGKDCKNGSTTSYNVARMGGAKKKELYFNSGYKNGLKDVTVKLCRWKEGQGPFDCKLPDGSDV